MEALSAAASTLCVRVVKDEFALDLVIYEVHLGADDEHECLLIDDHADALVLYHFIKLADLLFLHVIHHVGVPIAPTSAHVYLHTVNFGTVIFLRH